MIPLSLSSMSCLNHGPNSTPAVLDGYSYHEGMTCNVGNDFDIKYSQASIFETEDASQCITKCKDLGSLCNAFTHVRSSPQVAGKCYLWSSWVDVSKYTDDSRDCYVKAGWRHRKGNGSLGMDSDHSHPPMVYAISHAHVLGRFLPCTVHFPCYAVVSVLFLGPSWPVGLFDQLWPRWVENGLKIPNQFKPFQCTGIGKWYRRNVLGHFSPCSDHALLACGQFGPFLGPSPLYTESRLGGVRGG